MRRVIKIISLVVLFIAIPTVIVFGFVKITNNKSNTTARNTSNKITKTPNQTTVKDPTSPVTPVDPFEPTDPDLPDIPDDLGDVDLSKKAVTAYSKISLSLLEQGYEVFNAVKMVDGVEEYGIGYSDYNTCYTKEDSNKTFIESGFISFDEEKNSINEDSLTFINPIDENGLAIYDDKYSFIYSINEGNIPSGHFVYDNKYVKYKVVDNLVKIEELDNIKANYDLSLGSIYDYDKNDYIFIPYDEIDSSPLEEYALVEHLNSEEIKSKLEELIQHQNDEGYTNIEAIYITYVSGDLIKSYASKDINYSTINGFDIDILNSIEYDSTKEYLSFESDGSISIKELPPIPTPPESKTKGFWDFLVDGLVMVGAGAMAVVGVVASPYTGGASLMLTGAAISAGVQYFSETIIEGKTFSEVNWTKVAVMGVTGAISAAIPCSGVVGYLASGVVGGLSNAAIAAIDGGSPEEIFKEGAKGAITSVITHGLFSSCFVEGTKVLTNKGLVSIECIIPGMIVASYNVETNQLEYKDVIDISKNTCNKFTDIELENGEIITSTYNHPYYIKELNTYVKACFLDDSIKLFDKDGNYVKIKSVRNYDNTSCVYNLNVCGNHNYYVGESSILVHNNCLTEASTKIQLPNKETLQMVTDKIATNAFPAVVGFGGLIVADKVLENGHNTNIFAINRISNEVEIGFEYHAATMSSNTLSGTADDETLEDLARRKAKDLLGRLRNEGKDFGWKENELLKMLLAAVGISIASNLLDDFFKGNKDDNPRVYLGKYEETIWKDSSNQEITIGGYIDEAKKTPGNVVLNLPSNLWKDLVKKHTNEGMWVFNMFYLDFVMARNCTFVLVTPTNAVRSELAVPGGGSFYAKELLYIREFGYNWVYSDIPYQEVNRDGGLNYA